MATFPVAAVLTAGLVGLVLSTWLGGAAARWGFPVPDEKRRLGAIDGVRGYLALLVMVHHFATYLLLASAGGGWRDVDVPVLQSFGAGSVTLFFMITGALFFPKTWRGIDGNDWRAMYIGRAFRILPLQVVTVAIIAAVALERVDFHIGNTWISFPARFALWVTSWSQPMLFGYPGTAMVNAFVLWSLWAEWKFYLVVLPAIAVAMSVIGARCGRWLVPVVLLASGLVIGYLNSFAWQKLNYATFACGMLALLVRDSRAAPWLRSASAALVSGGGLVLAVTLSPVPDRILPLVGYFLFFACILCGNRFGGLVATRGALVLGEASFSIYMLHGILLNILFLDGAPIVAAIPVGMRPWLLIVAMPVMAGLAITTHLAVERPTIAVGRRLARRWGRPAAGQASQRRAAVSSVEVAP